MRLAVLSVLLLACGGEPSATPLDVKAPELFYAHQAVVEPSPLRNVRGEIVAMQMEIMLSEQPFDCTRSVADLVPAGVRLVEFHRAIDKLTFTGEYGPEQATTIGFGGVSDQGGFIAETDGGVTGYIEIESGGVLRSVVIEAVPCRLPETGEWSPS